MVHYGVTHQKRFNHNFLFKLQELFKNEHSSFPTPKSNTNETNVILTTIDYIDNYHNDTNDDNNSVTNNNNFLPCSKKVKQSPCQDITNARNNDASSTYIYSTSTIKDIIGTAFSNNKSGFIINKSQQHSIMHAMFQEMCKHVLLEKLTYVAGRKTFW